jgi:hypothetical protein
MLFFIITSAIKRDRLVADVIGGLGGAKKEPVIAVSVI